MFENLFCAAKVQKKIINRAKTYVFSQKVSDLYYPQTKKAFRLKDVIACELCSAAEGGLSLMIPGFLGIAFEQARRSALRKKGDSNPRYGNRIPVFETSAIDHSAILP